MCPEFDFDRFASLARSDPAAFEAQRLALFEAALGEMPASAQAAARVALAKVQVEMAGAKSPAQRLSMAMAALRDGVARLGAGMELLRGEVGALRELPSRGTDRDARR